MPVKEDDIYHSIERFKRKNGLSQEKMAAIMGLSTKQAYANMMKNHTMKLKYLVNIINHSQLPVDYFLGSDNDQ